MFNVAALIEHTKEQCSIILFFYQRLWTLATFKKGRQSSLVITVEAGWVERITGGQRGGVVGSRLSIQMSNAACAEVKEHVNQHIWNNQKIRID
jgi:hypothetical protein